MTQAINETSRPRKFKISMSEYRELFISENRIERIHEEYRVLDIMQSYIENDTPITHKHLSIPFSC